MLHIKNLNDGLELFKTLGSDVRMRIVELLSERGEMNMNEIATAVRCRKPLIQIVMNNHVLGMVRQWQTLFFDKHYSNTTLERKTDFVKLAEAFGMPGYRAMNMAELKEVLPKAFAEKGPVLVDCAIDCDAFVLPMLPPGGCIDDIIVDISAM